MPPSVLVGRKVGREVTLTTQNRVSGFDGPAGGDLLLAPAMEG
jgi:hypothetical protein